MCDTHAYIFRDGREELVLEHVDLVEAENGTLRVSNIFGEQKVVAGRIQRFSMRDNKIVITDQS